MKRLKVNRHLLHTLNKAPPRLRRAILKESSPEIVKTICEISHNVLKGNVAINKKSREHLKKYKRSLRQLASPKLKLSSKRKILVQRGGFLPVLLGTILSGVIGDILTQIKI